MSRPIPRMGNLIDKRQLRLALGRAAESYDRAAVLQREVCERMAERLDYIKLRPGIILDAGSGTGHGARGLAERYPEAAVIELDLTLGMLKHGERGGLRWKRLFARRSPSRKVCADLEALPLKHAGVELLWSNLALQWCDDLPRVFSEMHRVLKVDGLLMFSTLGPDTLKELRQAFQGIDRHTHVNQFMDMHDIGDMLMGCGFADPVMDMECLTLTYADAKSLMLDLKASGAHNVTGGRPRGLTGKSAWRKLLANYEALRKDGRFPATFEVVYGHAWKAPPRRTADGREVMQFVKKR